MSHPEGTAAWRELSDTHTRGGAPVPPDPEDLNVAVDQVVIPSVLSRWFVTFRDDLLSGRVTLEEILDAADYDMQVEQPPLCPVCLRHTVRPGSAKTRGRGVCAICWLHRLKTAHEEKITELEALKEYNAAKKSAQRLRDELGVLPARLKKARDYGGRHIHATDHPPTVRCDVCGEQFLPHGGATTCPECRELHERRARVRDGDSPPII